MPEATGHESDGGELTIGWRLRMAAAERGIWTAAALRRALAERAGYQLTAASVSALLTGNPREVRLATLAALCRTLDCSPDDLFVLKRRADDARRPASRRPRP